MYTILHAVVSHQKSKGAFNRLHSRVTGLIFGQNYEKKQESPPVSNRKMRTTRGMHNHSPILSGEGVPPPQKAPWIRDWVPLEGTWDQRLGYPSGRDLGPESGESSRKEETWDQR